MSAEKRLAGEHAAGFVDDDMIVGIGTGSTVYYTIQKLGQRVAEGLKIRGVSTSDETTKLCEGLGIPLLSLDEVPSIDLTIDGADEVDPRLNGIKGGHCALLREKLVAINSDRNVWVVDSSKLVEGLVHDSIPVEVIPFGCERTMAHIKELGYRATFREDNGERPVTDQGNYIVDVSPGRLKDPKRLESELKHLTGVVECGLFIDIADTVVVARGGDVEVLTRPV